MSPQTTRTLGDFHRRVSRRLGKMHPKMDGEGIYIYPLLDTYMKAVGMEYVDTFVLCSQNTVAQYIATRPILDLCLAAEIRPGEYLSMIWWEQSGLEIGKGGSETETKEE